MSSTHLKRILTSVVGVPLLVLVVLEGGAGGFAVLIGLAGIIGLLEFHGLFFNGGRRDVKIVGVLFSLSLFSAYYWCGFDKIVLVWIAGFYAAAILWVKEGRKGSFREGFFSLQIAGFFYVPCLLGHLILIRQWNHGVGWIFFLLVVVFSGDTGAYYVGKYFGRHKLSPKISPGKTVEGAIGGFLGSLLCGALFEVLWSLECGLAAVLALAAPVAVFGQIGDLFESMLKRSVGQKDSGALLPGHGGILDRIDGLLFAAPVLYYGKMIFV